MKDGESGVDRINETGRMIEDSKEWTDWGVGRIQFSVGRLMKARKLVARGWTE